MRKVQPSKLAQLQHPLAEIHTYKHTFIYIYIYTYIAKSRMEHEHWPRFPSLTLAAQQLIATSELSSTKIINCTHGEEVDTAQIRVNLSSLVFRQCVLLEALTL